jgi:hypothetical protein
LVTKNIDRIEEAMFVLPCLVLGLEESILNLNLFQEKGLFWFERRYQDSTTQTK